MGLLKFLFNVGNAEGIRESMRLNYRQARKRANTGERPSDFAPHVTAMMETMATRMASNGIAVNPTILWHETAPFLLIKDEEVAVEALAEYAVYVERTVDTKLDGLRETLNQWLRRARPDEQPMALVLNPLAMDCRWWWLLEPDVIERIETLRRTRRT
jgi:hypothetical protein